MKKALLTYEREKGLYQNKVTSSLAFTQRQGHQAHNCKMDYCGIAHILGILLMNSYEIQICLEATFI